MGDGDPDLATQECFSNDGRNVTEFIPDFPASCVIHPGVDGGHLNTPHSVVTLSEGLLMFLKLQR